MSRARYLLELAIKPGMEAPSVKAIGAAMEVGTEDAPADMGFEAIEQIIVHDAGEPSARSAVDGLIDAYDEALTVHIYDEQNGEVVPPEQYALVQSARFEVERLRGALQMVCDSGVPLADAIEEAMLAALGKPVVRPSTPEESKLDAEIAFFKEHGFSWEYPGFLMASGTPGFNFTVGLDDPNEYPVQVTTEDGANVELDRPEDNGGMLLTRAAVLACLEAFKKSRGLS